MESSEQTILKGMKKGNSESERGGERGREGVF